MTERQIEQLAKMLSESSSVDSLADSSAEFDDAILNASRESIQPAKASKGATLSNAMAFLTAISVPFIRSASLAVIVTIGVFFMMGQLVKVDSNNDISQGDTKRIDALLASAPSSGENQAAIALPNHIPLVPAPSMLTRDDILLSFDLSEAETLFARLSLEFERSGEFNQHDSAGTQGATIQLALLDINSLIKTGELNDARERYSDLIIACDGCRLPDTLEALVIASQEIPVGEKRLETG